MLEFLRYNWSDLLVSIVGLSAFAIYFIQKRDKVRSAATLILGQINSIEECVSELREDHQLGNISIYHSKVILRDNLWEQYKHLFVKRLSTPEYEIIQRFFENAEQLERAREDIINTITTAWKEKSVVLHQVIGGMVASNEAVSHEEIQKFQVPFGALDIVFTPDVAIQALTKNLNNFNFLTGTTAYEKIRKKSYNK